MYFTVIITAILLVIAKGIQSAVKGTKIEPVFKWIAILMLFFLLGFLGYQFLRLKAAGIF